MNVKYNINPETCFMRLQLKEDVLEGLLPIQQTIFNQDILPILNSSPKYIIAGSLGLKLLGFEKMELVGDFDLVLLNQFTEQDYLDLTTKFEWMPMPCLGNNFQLTYNPNVKAWKFSKTLRVEQGYYNYKLDIFNDEIYQSKDIIEVCLGDTKIKIEHPSINWSFRLRSALDTRTAAASKYWHRFKDVFYNQERVEHFFDLQRTIHRMIIAVEAHNNSIARVPTLINRIKELITQDTDYDKIFNITLEKEVLNIINPQTSNYPYKWDLGYKQ